MNENPALSIVVAWQKSQPSITDCLDSLYKQSSSEIVELIVVYGGFEPDVASLLQRHPKIVIVHSENSDALPRLHGYGIERAQADLIALTEAHTVFDGNWVEAVLKACSKSDAAAIGGVVNPGPKITAMDFALYLCDYVQFAAPIAIENVSDLPGNNIVFRRAVIEKFTSPKRPLKEYGFWKTFFCHELEEKGETLSREPSMVAYYNRHLGFSDVFVRRFHHGRCFGAMRSVDFTPEKRVLYAIAAVTVVPYVLFWRSCSKISKKPALLPRAIITYPLWTHLLLAWAIGEYYGTALGAGDSCDQL